MSQQESGTLQLIKWIVVLGAAAVVALFILHMLFSGIGKPTPDLSEAGKQNLIAQLTLPGSGRSVGVASAPAPAAPTAPAEDEPVAETSPAEAPAAAEAATETESAAAEETPEAPAAAPTAEGALAEQSGARPGRETYDRVCFACHTAGVLNAPKLVAGEWADRLGNGLDGLMANTINGLGSMPPRGGNPSLSDGDLYNAVVYMLNEAGVQP